jgi:rhomboid protease GluP
MMFGDRKKLVMCQACRGLVEASVKTCPLCGRESVPPLRIRVSEKAGSESFFSLLLLTINVALFIMMAAVDLSRGTEGITLMNTPSRLVFLDFGGRFSPAIQNGDWWRLITPNFLHLGLAHLLFNSIALYYIGPQVEGIFGSQKFIMIYLATGIFSNIASFTFDIGGAGASGALFGLIGLMLIYGHRLGGTMGQAIKRQMMIWAIIGFVYGIFIGADNVAHAGGFVAGVGMAYAVPPDTPSIARTARIWNAVAVGCALLVVASFTMVAINYGKFQSFALFERLHNNAALLESSYIKSLEWRDPANGGSKELASKLRAAAAGVERLEDADPQVTDDCRRLVEVANKRAAVLDSAETNPQAVDNSAVESYAEWSEAIDQFARWWRGIRQNVGV